MVAPLTPFNPRLFIELPQFLGVVGSWDSGDISWGSLHKGALSVLPLGVVSLLVLLCVMCECDPRQLTGALSTWVVL